MMKNRYMLMLCALWVSCLPQSDARDILTCPYNPAPRTVSGRIGSRKITAEAMYRRYREASNYDDVHPAFKALIEKNRDNYRYMAYYSLLYLNEDDGIGLYEQGGKILLYRSRVFGDDAAWEYEKEPAINPETGRPWIELTDAEWKKITKGNSGLTEQDEQFLNDVLAILNENFHYFYGMKLIDLGRDRKLDKAQLMGKFIPTKFLLSDKQIDMLNLSAYTEQQVSLYRRLGHPVYNYEGFFHPDLKIGIGSNCGNRGIVSVPTIVSTAFSMVYFLNACPNEINPSMGARSQQIHFVSHFLKYMVSQLEEIVEERGVNVRTQSQNKTALARALYLVYKKTKQYVEAVTTHEYVLTSVNTNELGKGVNHLYDVIPISDVMSGKKAKVSRKTRESFEYRVKKRQEKWLRERARKDKIRQKEVQRKKALRQKEEK